MTLFKINVFCLFFVIGVSLSFAQDDGHDHSSHDGHDHSSHAGEEDHSKFMQKICPVMGNPIDQKLFVENKDERIYICCEACRDEVKNNFKKYATMLTDQGIHLSEHLHNADAEHQHSEDCDHDTKKKTKKKKRN